MPKENFYSQRLVGTQRTLYLDCVNNLDRGILETACSLPMFGGSNALNDVIKAVLYGNPEFFFLDQRVEISRGLLRSSIKFRNKYDGDISVKKRELDEEISKIASRVRACGSTYDKLCRISAYLGERIRAINSLEPRFGDAYGALILKEARCEGYAKAAKLIMDRAGIRSEIVIGEALQNGRRFNHAWNMAYIGDKAYGFDFTWNDKGDGSDMPGADYLFLPDADMSKDHFAEYKYPACIDASQTFWARNNGIIRSRADIPNIRLGHIGNIFLAAIKFENARLAQELQKEALDTVMRLMSKLGRGTSFKYIFNDRLNVLSVYIIGQ